jgi:hypothetical protein
MSNVTMPTPVALAGGALCLLGGYLVGAVAGPDGTDRDTASVVSYDGEEELCLGGEAVQDAPQTRDGVLCGEWRRIDDGGPVPSEGDEFRFVTVSSDGGDGGDEGAVTTLIYGDVVR